MPCGHALAGRPCGEPQTRLYIVGLRCVSHTPAAIAGRPEPGQSVYCAPLRCYCGGHCDS